MSSKLQLGLLVVFLLSASVMSDCDSEGYECKDNKCDSDSSCFTRTETLGCDAFCVYDANGDGVVSRDEMIIAFLYCTDGDRDATCSLAEWLPFAMTFDITDEEAIQFWHAVCTWAPPSDVHNIDDDLAALYSCIHLSKDEGDDSDDADTCTSKGFRKAFVAEWTEVNGPSP